MAVGSTRYDLMRYPAGVYPASDPSRLAALARLHGLAAPDPARARVLEIAGGDAINLIAMAAGSPDARFTSFDLAPSAVERGQVLAAAAGLGNVEIMVGDVLDCATNLTGTFDYIVVHGLYAWVPDAVRAATLQLIGRVLAADGMAFVSYNALPGGYLRQAVRAMLMHYVGEEPDPTRRVALAREHLEQFVVAQPTDSVALAGLRRVAELMLHKSDGGLFHDELGDVYEPQLITAVVAAASGHGLAYLNDATPEMIREGLPGAYVAESDVVPRAQANDFAALAFFHRTLFIRSAGPVRCPSAFQGANGDDNTAPGGAGAIPYR